MFVIGPRKPSLRRFADEMSKWSAYFQVPDNTSAIPASTTRELVVGAVICRGTR